MSETNASTSLLSSCIACKASCCKGKKVTVTEIGYRKIIDAGHPDHFHKTEIPQGTYYVLDQTFLPDGRFQSHCPYLVNNKCSIEDEKPDSCKAYPMVRKIDHTGWVKEIGITKDCPAAEIAANIPAFKESTRLLVEQINQDIPPRLADKIVGQHKKNLRSILHNLRHRPNTEYNTPASLKYGIQNTASF